ncbi:type VI secretion system baseplate subunit TssF [Massilia sp. ZL223]|uniref:type VI secretion system baseplate subunit TssF n=1 Tax=Massilia sp. ZL223 TaxID=2824904 RepID=UPI001B81DF56|nr:type VI secretion system baseplate subunit TssF [Massilia sp. ZL223]MBQ5964998.1 type VI secretion system baseplate subunit TssF [Massilia sp. ZL223]
MEELLPYYERELVYLNTVGRELAQQYPKLADALSLGVEGSEDPHIRRLIQACALLNARTARKLDDDYPELTEALLGTLYPHFLHGIPSCSIVRVDTGPGPAGRELKLEHVHIVPRGTEMSSLHGKGTLCRFRTTSALAIAPVTVARACFEPTLHAPPKMRLPARASARISITLESAMPARMLHQLGLPRLRLYVEADNLLSSALLDTLFMQAAGAYVEADGLESWRKLERFPLALGGLDDDEALVPAQPYEHAAYRLLSEYFAFPEKFHFVDIDLAALAGALPAGARRFTLHVVLAGLHADANAARILKSLSAANLLPGCAPVVNLFAQPASPVRITQRATMYDVIPGKHEDGIEVYSIDSVHVLKTEGGKANSVEYRPYYGLRHGEGGGRSQRYWFARRDDGGDRRHRMKIAFTDDEALLPDDESSVASIDLTCTNGPHACTAGFGAPGGDLMSETATNGLPIRMLRKPTAPLRFASRGGTHWRLVTQLALNHRSLADLDAFREALSLYDLPRTAATQRQIAGVLALRAHPATAWLRNRYGTSLVHGTEITMTVDEEAFAGSSLAVFGQVVSRFFGLSVHLNSFTRLVLVSSHGDKELLLCEARNGDLSLV